MCTTFLHFKVQNDTAHGMIFSNRLDECAHKNPRASLKRIELLVGITEPEPFRELIWEFRNDSDLKLVALQQALLGKRNHARLHVLEQCFLHAPQLHFRPRQSEHNSFFPMTKGYASQLWQ